MAFSKIWNNKDLKPKKAAELRKKPVDVKGELDKLAPRPKDTVTPTIDFGGDK